MSIVGFNLTKIFIERKESFSGKLNIRSRIDVESIKQVDLGISKDKDTLQLNFIFEVIYEPDFAKIIFQGNVLLLEDSKKSKEVLKEWKKKKIEDDVKDPVFNTILRKCNIKAFSLEEDLNLPIHIPMRIEKQSQ